MWRKAKKRAHKPATVDVSPEQLDSALHVVSPQRWILLLVLSVAAGAVVVWAFFGTLPLRVTGLGMTQRIGAEVVRATAPVDGEISMLGVAENDTVRAGDVIAKLRLVERLAERTQLLQEIDSLARELNRRRREAGEALAVRRRGYAKRQTAFEARVAELRQREAFLADELSRLEADLKAGWVTGTEVENVRTSLADARLGILKAEEEFAAARVELEDVEVRTAQETGELELRLEQSRDKLQALDRTVTAFQDVESPATGKVIDVPPALNENVSAGTLIARIETQEGQRGVVAFLRPQDGKKVEPGMTVLASPSSVEREIYGSVLGKVVSVSERPMARPDVEKLLGNVDLVDLMMQKGPPFFVTIQLQAASDTPSGLRWTSSKGPPRPLSTSTLTSIVVDVEERRPIALLIPLLRDLTSTMDHDG